LLRQPFAEFLRSGRLFLAQVDLSRYTLDTYMRIVTYKTAYYTFYLPVACGLRLAGVT
jgi:farnesyl diphosphate synthase